MTKMRQDPCSAAQILQDAKIQDLELAIDQTPEVADDLIETVKLSMSKAPANGNSSKVALGNTIVNTEDTEVQVTDAKHDDLIRKLASDSSSESESDQKRQAGTAQNRFSMLGEDSADESDSSADEQ